MGMKPRKPIMARLGNLSAAYADVRSQLGIGPALSAPKQPQLPPRWDRVRDAAIGAFHRGRYRGLDTALVLINIVPDLARAEGRLLRFVNVDSRVAVQRPVYDVAIRQDWPERVLEAGLACVEQHFVLDADPAPIDQACKVAGVRQLWEVTFVTHGHGYGLRAERGLAGDLGARVKILVPYRTAHSDEDMLHVVQRGRRQLARRARRLRYQAWKASHG